MNPSFFENVGQQLLWKIGEIVSQDKKSHIKRDFSKIDIVESKYVDKGSVHSLCCTCLRERIESFFRFDILFYFIGIIATLRVGRYREIWLLAFSVTNFTVSDRTQIQFYLVLKVVPIFQEV